MTLRSYSEVARLTTFEERLDYLALQGNVGRATFGFDRYINQRFYTSRQWRQVRFAIIARDLSCDLGIPNLDINDRIYIHHMNPMTADDIMGDDESVLDPEYLICTTHTTHNAIHFGNKKHLPRPLADRRGGDTALW